MHHISKGNSKIRQREHQSAYVIILSRLCWQTTHIYECYAVVKIYQGKERSGKAAIVTRLLLGKWMSFGRHWHKPFYPSASIYCNNSVLCEPELCCQILFIHLGQCVSKAMCKQDKKANGAHRMSCYFLYIRVSFHMWQLIQSGIIFTEICCWRIRFGRPFPRAWHVTTK